MSKSLVSYTEHGIPIRNLWHMLLYAWNEPHVTPPINMGDVENAPTLDALFATILIRMIQQRIRIGLGRGYVPVSKKLRAVRGRVDMAESIKQHTFERGEAISDFHEYTVDEPRNRIVKSTLLRLVQSGVFGPNEAEAESLRHRLRWLARSLDGIAAIELESESIRRLALAQNDNDYRLMLLICEMIVMRRMPLDADGTNALPRVEREMLILHRVYERFVAAFYKLHLTGWQVNAQHRLHWHAQDSSEHLPVMIPDLILHEQETGRVIMLDTKFTAASLVENQWGKPVYDSSHLYQLYAYLRSQEQVSAGYRTAEGILLYPAVQARLSERVELQGHVIRIESLDLTAAWEDVERQMLLLLQ